eukprot:SAG11_NODE_1256_length_5374_cov_5.627627_11_plen_119_part_00
MNPHGSAGAEKIPSERLPPLQFAHAVSTRHLPPLSQAVEGVAEAASNGHSRRVETLAGSPRTRVEHRVVLILGPIHEQWVSEVTRLRQCHRGGGPILGLVLGAATREQRLRHAVNDCD